MNATELRKAIENLGWRITTSTMHNTGWYAWLGGSNRADWTDCTSNEKPPSFCVDPYEFEHYGTLHSSVKFRVCGEVNPGRWVDLRVYSVPMSECIESIPDATAILKAAWNAASKAVKP